MDQPLLQTGADRYVIVSRLAEGGMGAIFLGKKVGIGGFEKVVVLKQLLPEFTSRAEFIDLFLREARLSASLDHANIVHTIDLVTAGDDYFIVMEYVDGGDLRAITRRVKLCGHRLRPAAALFIAREVLAALGYAHEKHGPDGTPLNLIHRDVSPSNIMISAAGQVKLADFGIAKASTHKSVFYRVKGKVGYMSPEQAFANRPLDHRSDLYSLAVILYELLAGERLFVADLLSIPEQIYRQPVPSLEHDPAMPAGVDAVLRRSLALDPDERFQTAHEFLDALLQVTMEQNVLFGAADLSAHLREVCGPDPALWNSDVVEEPEASRPGTMIMDEEESSEGHPFTGVELTSMMTIAATPEGLAQLRDDDEVAPAAARSAYPPLPLDGEETGAWERPQETEDDFWGEQQTVAFVSPPRPPPPAPAAARGPSTGTGPEPALSERLQRSDRRAALPPRELSQPRRGPTHVAHPLDDGGPPPIGRRAARRRGPLHTTARVSARRGQRLTLIAALALLLTAVAIIVAVGLCGPSSEELAAQPDGGLPFGARTPDSRPPDLAPADAAPPDVAPPPPDRGVPPDAPLPADAAPAVRPTLTVKSVPGRAAVFLDGVRQCRTRCRIKDLDPERTYVLSVRRRGYVGWSRLVDPQKQPALAIAARLAREPSSRKVGYLVVRPTTPADVTVDGVRINHVTSEGRIPLRPGRHEVLLTHPRKDRVIRFMVRIYRQRITTTERMKF